MVAQQWNAHVPGGPSASELSTHGDPATKSSSDYRKRASDPLGFDPQLTTFIFTTSRNGPGRRAWAWERQAEDAEGRSEPTMRRTWSSGWSGRQRCTLGSRFLSGEHPAGVVDIDTLWTDWSPCASPSAIRTSQAIVMRRRAQKSRPQATRRAVRRPGLPPPTGCDACRWCRTLPETLAYCR